MVEGSQIDWGGHDNDAKRIMAEMIDFDKAIGIALEFAKRDGNTLVIVTADHETGGMALDKNKNDHWDFDIKFSYKDHTGVMVPVFAFGPGSENFMGIYENTAIFYKMLDSLKKK
jgi:alkaline phosphatase